MSTESDEAKELSLVGKLELRIALADSETKLQSLLSKFLTPLLLKLASPNKSVRDKVISVCQHVNTRIKLPSLQLPVASLLKQYKENANPLVRHFDLLYIQQGLDRVPIFERLDLLPTLVCGLANNYRDSVTNTASLFNVFLRLLHHFKLPSRGSEEDLELRERFGLADKSQDAEFLAEWVGKTFLFGKLNAAKNCPGLSAEDCEFLQLNGKTETWDPASAGLSLVETKVVAAKFLASGAFTESERFIPALVASADLNSRLSDVGDDMLKRAIAGISLEDEELITRLYSIYLGTGGLAGSPPAKAPLQGKILALFCKSKTATTFSIEIIKIVKEGLVLTASGMEGSNAPKKGLEASKLRGQVFSFTNWVARMGSATTLEEIAPTLVGDLRLYVEHQGWPKVQQELLTKDSPEVASRSYGYESIGLLARSRPKEMLLDPDLDLLRWLFRSLGGDNSGKDTSISIETALSSVLGAFADFEDESLENSLVGLLVHYMDLKPGDTDASGTEIVRSTRYLAVRFANRCLPFNNVTARWIDIIALAGGGAERNEVIEEGKRGLDPYWYQTLNPSNIDARSPEQVREYEVRRYAMPNFGDLVGLLFRDDTQASKLGQGYMTAIVFCRSVLFHQALSAQSRQPTVDASWQKNLDALILNDEEARKTVEKSLGEHKNEANFSLARLMNNAFTGLVEASNGDPALAGSCLLELCSLGPGWLLDSGVNRLSELQSAIFSSKYSSRVAASHVFGLLGSRKAAPTSEVQIEVKTFFEKAATWNGAVGSTVHQVHGSILSLAYLLSREFSRGTISAEHEATKKQLVALIVDILRTGRDKDLLDAALIAFDQLCVFGVFGIDSIPGERDMSTLIKRLEEMAKEGNEKAVAALGHFAMQCPEDDNEDSLVVRIIGILEALHEQRQPELQFAVGSALSCVAVGWKSTSLIGVHDVEGPLPISARRDKLLGTTMEKVLKNCKQTKPALRQASVICLLCLVQYCGHLPEIHTQLRLLQQAFKSFLSDRESLNQETASRGLTIVYEKGDREIKDDLVRDLVGSFTGTGSNLAGKVTTETELFEPGALPTGDGSVTTYKDIVSLANEVGDPSLIYRFMSMASSSSIWSSRAAFGRFGLSKILSDSSVDGYLANNPKLYPALFRYRFDPNTNVRNAMNDIWAALVKDPKATIDRNFDGIMEDLLKNILGKEWRTREASCAAIAELIQGKTLAKYESYLTRIWTVTFKVCDDIKDTVRRAAMSLARVLTGVLIRSFEGGEATASTSNAMLKQVLPFLLSPSGLESSAAEVQSFALSTLLEIIKKGSSKALRPFLGELVGGRLLPLLSSLEPEAINYIHLNADKYGMTEQQIDDARLSSVKMSPMMEAIERCLDMLDESSMKDLVQHLTNATKTVIGLPSKVGVSRVLVSLSTRHNNLFSPYADGFLRLLRRQVLDRNDAISTSAAAACGYLGRIVTDEQILKHIDYAKGLYFNSEDEKHRVVAGELALSLAKYATDRCQGLASSLMPFVFVAMHDTNDSAKTLFKSTWDESVGGSRAIQLYLPEICSLAVEYLGSPKWALKHASSFAVADAAKSLGKDISTTNTDIVWPVLEKAIGGKTWEGKEKVLEAFVAFAKNSASSREDKLVARQMQKIMVRESKRNNTGVYRQNATRYLGDFIEIFPEIDWFEQVHEIVAPIVESLLDEAQDMDVDSSTPGGLSSKLISEETLANAMRTLMRSVNPSLQQSIDRSLPAVPRLSGALAQCVKVVQAVSVRRETVVQNAIFEGETALFQKLSSAVASTEGLDDSLLGFLATTDGLDDAAETTRVKAAEALEGLTRVAKNRSKVRAELERTLERGAKADRSHSVQQILKRARLVLDE